jgi:hypothetical protein
MFSQISTSLWRTGLSGGAPDSVWCPGWPGDKLAALGNRQGRCGYKSPDCPMSHQRPRSRPRRRSRRSREKAQAPRLKITRLSGAPTAPTTNGRQRNQRVTRGPRQRSIGHTRLSGVHRTVSGAPIRPEAQRSTAPDKEGDRAPDNYCPCPVVHRAVRCTTQ